MLDARALNYEMQNTAMLASSPVDAIWQVVIIVLLLLLLLVLFQPSADLEAELRGGNKHSSVSASQVSQNPDVLTSCATTFQQYEKVLSKKVGTADCDFADFA